MVLTPLQISRYNVTFQHLCYSIRNYEYLGRDLQIYIIIIHFLLLKQFVSHYSYFLTKTESQHYRVIKDLTFNHWNATK